MVSSNLVVFFCVRLRSLYNTSEEDISLTIILVFSSICSKIGGIYITYFLIKHSAIKCRKQFLGGGQRGGQKNSFFVLY